MIIASSGFLCAVGLYWALADGNPQGEIVSRSVAQLSVPTAPNGFVSARVQFEVNTHDGSAKACAQFEGRELCAQQSLPNAQPAEIGRYSIIPWDALIGADGEPKGTDVYIYDNQHGQIFRYSLEGVSPDQTLVLNVMPVKGSSGSI